MSATTSLVVASLGAGLLLALGGWLWSGDPGYALARPMGDPTFDFSKSWASSLTVFNAVLGTVLAAKILPSAPTVIASPSGYTALSLLFGVLVVLAPLLFTALRKGRQTAKGPAFDGYGWAFLIATMVTLWGVLGELGTIGLMLYEAQHGNTVPLGAVLPMMVAIGLALVLVAIYALQTIRFTLAKPSEAQIREAEELVATFRLPESFGVRDVPDQRTSFTPAGEPRAAFTLL